MSFQTRKTFVHFCNTNYDIFDEIWELSDPYTVKAQKRSIRTLLKQSICHQWFNLNFMKQREYFLYAKQIKTTLFNKSLFNKNHVSVWCGWHRTAYAADILQNGATVTQMRRIVEWSHYFYFLCVQKVFLSLHKVQIEPLMAEVLFLWCFSYFSGPKYFKLCSEDEQSFYGFGTTWG